MSLQSSNRNLPPDERRIDIQINRWKHATQKNSVWNIFLSYLIRKRVWAIAFGHLHSEASNIGQIRQPAPSAAFIKSAFPKHTHKINERELFQTAIECETHLTYSALHSHPLHPRRPWRQSEALPLANDHVWKHWLAKCFPKKISAAICGRNAALLVSNKCAQHTRLHYHYRNNQLRVHAC